jgi:protein translocase SecG subunit
MKNLFLIVYALVAVSVIVLVLLQGRGGGLGSAWGGGGGESFSTRRGVERFSFILTIALVGLFLLLSIAYLFI